MQIPRTLIFIGPQGSGKGTQGKIIAKKIGAEYIETGALLRKISKQDSSFGKYVGDLIDNGNMVTDEDIEKVLQLKLNSLHPKDPIIFDGVPRRIHQAAWILEHLKEVGREDVHTFFFGVPRAVSEERLLLRRVCSFCGRTTILHHDDQVCEKCGSKLIKRRDDTPEFINLRLDTYERETKPVVDFLKQHTTFHEIKADQDIQHVTFAIEKILGIEIK